MVRWIEYIVTKIKYIDKERKRKLIDRWHLHEIKTHLEIIV
jgi:transposase-like protein